MLKAKAFQERLEKHSNGGFQSNKAFRADVLDTLIKDFGMTLASAASFYNHCRLKALEDNPTLAELLQRDPKKEAAPRRTALGRPYGSKNKPKE